MAKKKWKKKERIETARLEIAEKRKGTNYKAFVPLVLVIFLAAFIILGQNGRSGINPVAAGDFETLNGFDNTHVQGQVTLMEFFDFYCSHCYQFHRDTWPLLQEDYGTRLILDDRGYPLQERSKLPLEAYEVAKDLGKGEEFKDVVFKAIHEDGRDVSNADALAALAATAGMDEAGFKEALLSGTKKGTVEENRRLGISYGLKGTPTFVVDGNMRVVDRSYENLKTIADSLLQEESKV